MYRPHFAYPRPQGCTEVAYEYFYDSSVMTAQSIPALGEIFSIIFNLDRDAEFRWRGTKIGIQGVSQPLEIQWKDPFGNVLSDVVTNTFGDPPTINTVLYATGSGFSPDYGGIPVPWDEEIVCPAGSVIECNAFRPNAGSALTFPTLVTLYGVKRYYGSAQ